MKRKLSVTILAEVLVQIVLLDCKPIQPQGTPIVASVVPSTPPEKEALSGGEPQRGGTVVISSGAGTPRHFNPALVSGTATAIVGAQFFNSPLRHDEHWNPLPYMAESWNG